MPTLEKIKESLSVKKKRIAAMERQLKEKERKQKSKKLIEIGQLAIKAGISNIEHDTLLGAFLEIREKSNEESVRDHWEKIALNFKSTDDDYSNTPISISFREAPPDKIKKSLKKMKFKWNSFRGEYYGYGDKSTLESLLKEMEHTIEILP